MGSIKLNSMLLQLIVCATAVLPFAALAQTEDPLLDSIRKTGEVKVGLGSAPPLVIVSPDGKATGYIVEMINLTLKHMGLPPLTPVVLAWSAVAPAMQAHQIDIGGVASITNERCRAVAISAPFFIDRDALFVLRGNPKHVTSVDEVAHSPEIKLAVVTGSTQEVYAKGHGIKPEQLVQVPDVQAGAATVIGGRADIFQVGRYSILKPEQNGLEVVIDNQLPLKGIGIAFRKEDARFRDRFNEHLNELRDNGVMNELYTVKHALPNWDVLAKLASAGDLEPNCK
ncbi:transporter substrate-binding domain-containing protein [Bradyrhizobium sp. USDA 4506]